MHCKMFKLEMEKIKEALLIHKAVVKMEQHIIVEINIVIIQELHPNGGIKIIFQKIIYIVGQVICGHFIQKDKHILNQLEDYPDIFIIHCELCIEAKKENQVI